MKGKRYTLFFIIIILAVSLVSCGRPCTGSQLRLGSAHEVGMDARHLQKIEEVIRKAIEEGKLPGATVLVGRNGVIVYKKAIGHAQLIPEKEPMTINRIFDMASVSKPIGTATSIMILAERGQLRLMDAVNEYIPGFQNYMDENGHEWTIRIYHLLTHTSGLPPYTNADTLQARYGAPCPDKVIERIATMPRMAPPGEEFHYSCLGFITLAEIVHRVSGQTIGQFAHGNIFEPLGMNSTAYCPPESWKPWIAPTIGEHGEYLRGFVHDPLAQLMDGQSGNAGLFSSACDLGVFCQMLLNGGSYGGVRILSPLTVKAMTTLYDPLAFAGRGLGWDVYSDYSSNMGDIFPRSSFGHTGFTGTSVCIDPTMQTFVILLSNRVHMPHGDVIALRSKVANIVASSITDL